MWMEIKCLVITKSRFAGVNETERRRFPFFFKTESLKIRTL